MRDIRCIICYKHSVGWALLLFCPAIIFHAKHFFQKNSSTQINLALGEKWEKHGIKICRLVKDRFILEVKGLNDKEIIIVCHFKKSPQTKIYEEKGIFCVNLSSQMRELLFKESSFLLAGKHEPTESRIYKGCKRRQFWPQCRKRESCSVLHFSQIPFTYFCFKEHLMWSISTFV